MSSTALDDELKTSVRQRASASKATANEPEHLPAHPSSAQQQQAKGDDGGDTGKGTTEQVPMGKTPDGKVFPIPQTHNMLSSLFDPRLPKSHIDLLTLALLALQFVLFFTLSNGQSRVFFLFYFALWRLAYNGGLGYVLKRQSEYKWIVRTVVKKGWMDENKRPMVHKWVTGELKAKMGKDYDFDVWIMFRHFVDVILLNDFLSYCFFAFSYLQTPPGHSTVFHILRWVGGWTLIFFNLWVKVDAHRIVKDYAWYWGDAFFLSLQELVFDGVFEFAPHPMYSVGYAGYYGLSLIVASETVLFTSLAAHACQFAFLMYFENPHIERTYGQRKPIAARMPLEVRASIAPIAKSSRTTAHSRQSSLSDAFSESTKGFTTSSSTPTLTDGADSDSETENELESIDSRRREIAPKPRKARMGSFSQYDTSTSNSARFGDSTRGSVTTRHDLDNRYFRNDLLLLQHFDFFRNKDFAFVLVAFYSIMSLMLPTLGKNTQITLAFINALAWRIFHSFGLGFALKAQSERKWVVRHFVKHYHYEKEGQAVEDAFANWKATYNLSLCMSYASFCALAWKCYNIPVDWTVGSQLVRHALGALLVALHVWTAQSTLEVLGPFGWFYGDFFIQDYPHQLYYTGIFRFLNNPERSMGGAAFFGLVLICGSKLLLVQAVIAVAAHWWFLSFVENPHMRKLYGNTLRKDAGVTKTLRNVAARNAHVFSGVSRGVKEVQGTFEKVFEETADALEEFLNRSGPLVKDYVNDTRILLKQTGERLVISRVANDLGAFDASRYSINLRQSQYRPSSPYASTSSGPARFHLGEPISVEWKAPANHSRKDWIGIYRLGANQSQLVTKLSSQGRWVGVHDAEWRGDSYEGGDGDAKLNEDQELVGGCVTFTGNKLPWTTGKYEIRYHHDGKHNVMAIAKPVEIFVEKPAELNDPQDVYETLTMIIANVLAFDPNAIPASAQDLIPQHHFQSPAETKHKQKSRATEPPEKEVTPSAPISRSGFALSDRDDFAIYSIDDASHIAYAISEAFEVELANEVILAAANSMKLAQRIVEARRLLHDEVGATAKKGTTKSSDAVPS